ncbi:MAG TPA: PqqD family protein [Bacteroidales bacterium]|nr:PqqD family protein [Bacteroidales bacterium]HSA43507.1 PqqD family protein [Bacteroidales bacterium]
MKPFKAPVKRKQSPEINYLTLTPYARVGHRMNQENMVELLIPRFSSPFLQKVLMRATNHKHIRIRLDLHGSETWKRIDGNSTVSDICSALSEQPGLNMNFVEDRVTRFLTKLYTEKYIGFKEFDRQEATSGR